MGHSTKPVRFGLAHFLFFIKMYYFSEHPTTLMTYLTSGKPYFPTSDIKSLLLLIIILRYEHYKSSTSQVKSPLFI